MRASLTIIRRQALVDCAAGRPYAGCMRASDFTKRHRAILWLIKQELVNSRDSVTLRLTTLGRVTLERAQTKGAA